MKKVQIFIREYNYGGVEKQVSILANALSGVYNVEIVILDSIYEDTENISKKVKIHELKIKETDSFIGRIRVKRALKKFIAENKADTIISTNTIFNSVLGRYAKNANLIYWEYKLNINDYKTLELSLVNFNRIVFPNEFMKDCYPTKNIKVSVIPLTFEEMPVNASKLNTNYILALGRLNKNKCYNELIEIMESVHEHNEKIKLIIIGDGEEKKNLVKMVKDKKMDKYVIFKGFLRRNEINELMEKSSLFVSVAKKESFGVSIIEAMSYGIPCVSYEQTSLKDFMKNEINGYLIENRDSKKMVEVILDVMENKKLRENLGNCARETSIIYDIASVKSEWIKII